MRTPEVSTKLEMKITLRGDVLLRHLQNLVDEVSVGDKIVTRIRSATSNTDELTIWVEVK